MFYVIMSIPSIAAMLLAIKAFSLREKDVIPRTLLNFLPIMASYLYLVSLSWYAYFEVWFIVVFLLQNLGITFVNAVLLKKRWIATILSFATAFVLFLLQSYRWSEYGLFPASWEMFLFYEIWIVGVLYLISALIASNRQKQIT